MITLVVKALKRKRKRFIFSATVRNSSLESEIACASATRCITERCFLRSLSPVATPRTHTEAAKTIYDRAERSSGSPAC